MRQTYDGFKKQKRRFFALLVLCVDHSSVIVKGRATTATEFSQTAQQEDNRMARILKDRKFNFTMRLLKPRPPVKTTVFF